MFAMHKTFSRLYRWKPLKSKSCFLSVVFVGLPCALLHISTCIQAPHCGVQCVLCQRNDPERGVVPVDSSNCRIPFRSFSPCVQVLFLCSPTTAKQSLLTPCGVGSMTVTSHIILHCCCPCLCVGVHVHTWRMGRFSPYLPILLWRGSLQITNFWRKLPQDILQIISSTENPMLKLIRYYLLINDIIRCHEEIVQNNYEMSLLQYKKVALPYWGINIKCSYALPLHLLLFFINYNNGNKVLYVKCDHSFR